MKLTQVVVRILNPCKVSLFDWFGFGFALSSSKRQLLLRESVVIDLAPELGVPHAPTTLT